MKCTRHRCHVALKTCNGSFEARCASEMTSLTWSPAVWTEVKGGYTPAIRYAVRSGARRAFVKIATTPLTVTMLRREIKAYNAVSGPFCAKVFGWYDDADQTLLCIEDLSLAHWPPPWRDKHIVAALETIDQLHKTPAMLPSYDAVHGWHRPGWCVVSSDPWPFLSLGLVSNASVFARAAGESWMTGASSSRILTASLESA